MNITLKVAAVIVNNNEQTLLIKEQYAKEDGFKWNLVKGTFDNPNETIEECIKREIQEEVGLSNLGTITLKKILHYGTLEQPKILFIFSTRYTGKQTPTTNNNKQDENIAEIKWFTREEINKLTKEDCMSLYVYDLIKDNLEQGIVVDKM